jgi:DNA-binding transcriptional regulator YiaG
MTTTNATKSTIKRKVAGRTFTVEVPAVRDAEYGDTVSLADLARAELEIASQLALEGPVSGEAFRYMRGALGIQAKDLATLLDVTPETVSRWENGARDLDRGAWIALGGMALEKAGKPTVTRERLERAARTEKPPRERHLIVGS